MNALGSSLASGYTMHMMLYSHYKWDMIGRMMTWTWSLKVRILQALQAIKAGAKPT